MKENSNYNLLIFTIISAIVSLGLVMILGSNALEKYLPLFITVETGLLIIIIWIFIKIFEKRDVDLNKIDLKFNECPDFYTTTTKDNIKLCVNEYQYNDESGQQLTFKTIPISETVPLNNKPLDNLINNESSKKWEVFNINEINDTFLDKNSAINKCIPLFNDLSGDLKNQKLNGYNKVPWTTQRALCEPLI